jgi:hypothetical protein
VQEPPRKVATPDFCCPPELVANLPPPRGIDFNAKLVRRGIGRYRKPKWGRPRARKPTIDRIAGSFIFSLRQLTAIIGHIADHGHLVIASDHSVAPIELGQFEIAIRFKETLGLKGRIAADGFENHLPTCGEVGTIAVDNLTSHWESLRIAAPGNATKTEE